MPRLQQSRRETAKQPDAIRHMLHVKTRFALPLGGLAAAIAVTTSLDATGLTVFSALPLLPLGALFWWLERIPRRNIGLIWGRARDYGLAALYPIAVLSVVATIAISFGGAHVEAARWPKIMLNLALMGTIGIPVGLLTEEGFFRGWLWASLCKRGVNAKYVLVITSVAFAIWHLSYVTLAKGYTLPPAQIVLFIVNAAVMGAIWGMMRSISGSIVVSSVCHALWNAGAYVFFGEGPKPGAFGMIDTFIFAPEIGLVGLAANLLFLATLYVCSQRMHKGQLMGKSLAIAAFVLFAISNAAQGSPVAQPWRVDGLPSVRTQRIVFYNAGARLHGTLYMPAIDAPLAAIVALQDASVGNADAALYRHLRVALPAIGMAVLLFDRRGSGASTGSARNATYETLADDGIAGARAIANLPHIDRLRIGYWGLSQGGWLALLAAGRDPNAAFVISVSAPLVTPAVQMEFAMANRLRILGYPQSDINAMLAARRAWSDYVAGRLPRASAVAALAPIEHKPWFDLMYLPTPTEVPADPTATSWRKHMNEDPLAALKSLRIPALLIFGGADPWIPVNATLARLRPIALAHPNITYAVIPNASHEMMLLPRASMSTDERTLRSLAPDAPAYLVLLGAWLGQHVLQA